MKLILSTIIGAVILFLLGWLLWMVILMNMKFYVEGFAAVIRGQDMKLWALIVGCITEAFFLALIYPKFYKGGSPSAEGFKFGIFIGLLMCVPYVFYTWSNLTVTWQATIAEAIAMFINVVVACLAIGLVYGKIEKPAA